MDGIRGGGISTSSTAISGPLAALNDPKNAVIGLDPLSPTATVADVEARYYRVNQMQIDAYDDLTHGDSSARDRLDRLSANSLALHELQQAMSERAHLRPAEWFDHAGH